MLMTASSKNVKHDQQKLLFNLTKVVSLRETFWISVQSISQRLVAIGTEVLPSSWTESRIETSRCVKLSWCWLSLPLCVHSLYMSVRQPQQQSRYQTKSRLLQSSRAMQDTALAHKLKENICCILLIRQIKEKNICVFVMDVDVLLRTKSSCWSLQDRTVHLAKCFNVNDALKWAALGDSGRIPSATQYITNTWGVQKIFFMTAQLFPHWIGCEHPAKGRWVSPQGEVDVSWMKVCRCRVCRSEDAINNCAVIAASNHKGQ